MRFLSDRMFTLQNTRSPERLFCTVFARRLRMSHYLSYTRAHRPFPRYTRTLKLFMSFPVKESLHFTFPFLWSGCKPKKKKFLQYSCLKMFFYLLVLKLTLFSCSEEISLFTRSFLASNLSALTNMFCLWVSKSASRAAVDWTSRLRTKIQTTRCHYN